MKDATRIRILAGAAGAVALLSVIAATPGVMKSLMVDGSNQCNQVAEFLQTITFSNATALKTDVIAERTGAAGVTIDGMLVKDLGITLNAINDSGIDGITIDGINVKDGVVYTDTVSEASADAGVTVDGLLIKDGAISGMGNVIGPATNTADSVPQWNGADSKTLKDGLAVGNSAGNLVSRSADNTLDARIIAPIGVVASIDIATPSGLTLEGISERTLDAGVIVEGVTFKDSGLALGADADGDLYYRAGGVLARLAKGTAFQSLAMNSGATAPEWAGSEFGFVYIDAGAMAPATTNGATTATKETSSNKVNYDVMVFPGTGSGSADTHAWFKIQMPEDWDFGNITFRANWEPATGASASDYVQLYLAAVAVANDGAVDVALGTALTTDDQVITVGDLHITPKPVSLSLTVGGSPATGAYQTVYFRISRNYDYDGGGTAMAEDLWLHGIKIKYTKKNSPEDF